MNRNSRAAVIAVAAAVFFLIVFVLSGPSWAAVAYRLITDGGLVIVWLLTAGVIGRLICKAGLITEIAMGLGIISLLVLGLGLAGWLNHVVAAGLLVGGFVVGAVWLSKSDSAKLKRWLNEPAGGNWLWIVAMLPLGASVVGALLPPGLLWGDEPNGYDVVEYHLQIPRQWFEAGRITPLPENVFSYFPQGMEMHYLLAMEARGGPWAGMYAAQLMHVAFCALAVAAVAEIAGTLSGIIMAATPWISLLAPVAYVEGAMLLYGTLAIGWVMQSIGSRGFREMFIAGAMAGFACGVKLTDVPMILLAIPIAVALADRSGWFKKSAVFVGIGLLAFSPWLVRNAIWTGNPVFPEAMNVFGRGHFSEIQAERWRRAYVPTTGRMQALGEQIVWDDRYGFIVLPAALIVGAVTIRSPRSRFLVAMLVILAIVWIGFTHLQSRFFVLAIPIAAMLLGEANPGLTAKTPRRQDKTRDVALRRGGAEEFRSSLRASAPQRETSSFPADSSPSRPAAMIGMICFLLACNAATVGRRLIHYLSDLNGDTFLGIENLAGLAGPDPAKLPADAHIDLVGDARAFLYPFPMSRLTYRTVFDVGSSGDTIKDWTGKSDVSSNHLLVIDPAELHRLHRTYFQISDLSEDELARLAARPDVYVILPGR